MRAKARRLFGPTSRKWSTSGLTANLVALYVIRLTLVHQIIIHCSPNQR